MENRPNHPLHKFTVAVIGGGFTGTTLAAQLVRHTDASYSLIVIERTGLPGRGVAYGTECNSHLLNVPAKDMSAFPEDREHFLRWAKSNYDSETEPCSFLPRKVYGRYLGSLLSEAALADEKQRLQWRKDEARALSPRGDGQIEIQLRSGTRVFADKVVLALGNFPSSDPLLPWRNPANRPHDLPDPDFGDPYFPDPYFPDPWSDTIFEAVEHLDQILLLGSGLTGVDVAVELRRRGFRGTIHFLSRTRAVASFPQNPHSLASVLERAVLQKHSRAVAFGA